MKHPFLPSPSYLFFLSSLSVFSVFPSALSVHLCRRLFRLSIFPFVTSICPYAICLSIVIVPVVFSVVIAIHHLRRHPLHSSSSSSVPTYQRVKCRPGLQVWSANYLHAGPKSAFYLLPNWLGLVVVFNSLLLFIVIFVTFCATMWGNVRAVYLVGEGPDFHYIEIICHLVVTDDCWLLRLQLRLTTLYVHVMIE